MGLFGELALALLKKSKENAVKDDVEIQVVSLSGLSVELPSRMRDANLTEGDHSLIYKDKSMNFFCMLYVNDASPIMDIYAEAKGKEEDKMEYLTSFYMSHYLGDRKYNVESYEETTLDDGSMVATVVFMEGGFFKWAHLLRVMFKDSMMYVVHTYVEPEYLKLFSEKMYAIVESAKIA